MNISELKSAVDELGFDVDQGRGSNTYVKALNGMIIASVNNTTTCSIDTNLIAFKNLESVRRNLLYDILSNFAVTPLFARQVEDIFVYKAPDLISGGDFLNITDHGTTYERVIFSDTRNTQIYKARFTDSEVEALGDRFKKIFAMCEKINVEDL